MAVVKASSPGVIDTRVMQESIHREERARKQWEAYHGSILREGKKLEDETNIPSHSSSPSRSSFSLASRAFGRVHYAAGDAPPAPRLSHGRRDYDRPWLSCTSLMKKAYAEAGARNRPHPSDRMGTVLNMGFPPDNTLGLTAHHPRHSNKDPLVSSSASEAEQGSRSNIHSSSSSYVQAEGGGVINGSRAFSGRAAQGVGGNSLVAQEQRLRRGSIGATPSNRSLALGGDCTLAPRSNVHAVLAKAASAPSLVVGPLPTAPMLSAYQDTGVSAACTSAGDCPTFSPHAADHPSVINPAATSPASVPSHAPTGSVYRQAHVTHLEGQSPFRRRRSDFDPLMQR